jgi:hypothetical protein
MAVARRRRKNAGGSDEGMVMFVVLGGIAIYGYFQGWFTGEAAGLVKSALGITPTGNTVLVVNPPAATGAAGAVGTPI